MSDDQDTIDGLEFVTCIASGSHSQIWEVSEPGSGTHLAMKLMVPEAMQERENVSTLKHEAKVQKSLVHPHFIAFHRIVTNKQHAYILMDFCRAPNLKSQLLADPMGLQVRAQKLIEGLCVSLGYMHDKGWLHRDIKPENILFNKSGELKLIDFSLSVRYSSGIGKMFAGSPKSIQGTRTYIAPETIQKKPPSPQTDMYSLGITLYEVLTGQRPFTAPTPDVLLSKHLREAAPPPSEYNRNLTPEADQFVLRMLSKKPEKRHANMNELLAEFRSLKLFKEDVAELRARAERKKKEIEATGGDLNKAWTLDSRTDDLRKKAGIAPPPKPKSKRRPAPPPEKKQPAASAPNPQQAPPPGVGPDQPQPGHYPQPAPGGYFPPGMYPPQVPQYAPLQPMPGQPYPQPPYAQQPYPQQPYPQQPYPPQNYPPQNYPPAGYPPGYPQPAAGVPPQQPPGGPPPQGQPIPAGMGSVTAIRQPQQPVAPAIDQSQPGVDQISRNEAELRPQAPVPLTERHASQKEDDRDLPLMEDLPDIM